MDGHADGLVTVIPIQDDAEAISGHMLRTFVEDRLATDDVFLQSFLSAVIFSGSRSDLRLESDARAVLAGWSTQWFDFATRGSYSLILGPQLLCNGMLMPVSRLYEDEAGVFMPHFNFGAGGGLRRAAGAVPGNRIAVRSRAAMPIVMERPLQGMRMTVKDMFDLRGHRTGLGSKAYLELAEPAKKTAPTIQRLLDLGADLVGVSKLCAMVGKTDPTQTIDYEAPWNPRADGFQSPSGGSSGQPAALATYDWLDFAIGSDATVSGRLPAQANGTFSFRPTVGIVSTEGMWSAAAAFDAPCVFARDIDLIQMIAELWQTKPLSDQFGTRTPRIYLVMDFLPLHNKQQMSVFNSFVEDVCSCLKQRVKQLSIAEIWKRNPPPRAKEQELEEFLSPTVATQSYVSVDNPSFLHQKGVMFGTKQRKSRLLRTKRLGQRSRSIKSGCWRLYSNVKAKMPLYCLRSGIFLPVTVTNGLPLPVETNNCGNLCSWHRFWVHLK